MIVVPDDFPSVFEGSAAHERATSLGAVRVCTERGAEDEAELTRRVGAARVAINIRAYARFSDTVFRACPALRMVSIWGTGTDNIDLDAAARCGVTVCNTPGVNAIAVAEHALALMLAVARKIPQIDREMRAGAWPREMLAQLHGKTLGVFGIAFRSRSLRVEAITSVTLAKATRVAFRGTNCSSSGPPARVSALVGNPTK